MLVDFVDSLSIRLREEINYKFPSNEERNLEIKFVFVC